MSDPHLSEAIAAALALVSNGDDHDGAFVASRDVPSLHRAPAGVEAPIESIDAADLIEEESDDGESDDEEMAGEGDEEDVEDEEGIAPPLYVPPGSELDFLEDDRVKPPRSPISLDAPLFAVSLDHFSSGVVANALETLGGLGRARLVRPMGDRREAERLALAQIDAIAVSGDHVVRDVREAWATSFEVPDPHVSWAAVIALLSLDGDATANAVREGIEAAPLEAVAHAPAITDAIVAAPSPHRDAITRDLVASESPLARAVGVSALGRQGALDASAVLRFLGDPSPAVLVAALDAASRLHDDERTPLSMTLQRYLDHPDADVAWAAVVTMLGRGDPSPMEALRAGDKLLATLGLRAAEAFVLAGKASDVELLARILRGAPVGPLHVSVMGRFGHARGFGVLAWCLADDDLAADAADALTCLFGPIVPPAERLAAAAWRSAVEQLKPSPDVRIRLGKPWRPSIAVEECRSPERSSLAAALRAEELRVRLRLAERVDIGLFLPDVERALQRLLAAAERLDRAHAPGSW